MCVRLLVAVSAAWLAVGCNTQPPPQSRAAEAPTRVVGKVESSDGTLPLAGRGVDAVNLTTGERHTVVTGRDGNFVMTLMPGTWHLELHLDPGEELTSSPHEPITVPPGAARRDLQFLVSTTTYRPRRPASPRVVGLGSPTT
jgi:hypothetical protein